MCNREQLYSQTWDNALLTVVHLIEQEKVAYTLIGESALVVQGICPDPPCGKIEVSVQWDAFARIREVFTAYMPEATVKRKRTASFTFTIDAVQIEIICHFGTVIRTDPDRICVLLGDQKIFVKSPDVYLRRFSPAHRFYKATKKYLCKLQNSDSGLNRQAWNEEAYQAWIGRFGTPEEAAARIRRDPEGRLLRLIPYFDAKRIKGKKVMNLLGSHGEKALALTLLGAEVTVADISQENATYARRTAEALGVTIQYVVSDVLRLPEQIRRPVYDIVLMEFGVLHYFVDLAPLAQLVYDLLKPGGRLILQEFHPISTKLVTTRGKRQIVFGNYFDKSFREREVAYGKHLPSDDQVTLRNKVTLREWTLGETVTAFASTGLRVERLDEAPNTKISDIGLPKTFTLLCSKNVE
ncbi:class I SAM-dependent methyltransferase [Sporolactobacillus sp. Y61]|uniref:Class I SAM-dependent methyltransferase n=1 Tax=Sporolactobacillus sp. Y61 TaxID=3160863 RepID=A0AAU8ICW1_9BACL